jgi:hypothetical protein
MQHSHRVFEAMARFGVAGDRELDSAQRGSLVGVRVFLLTHGQGGSG